MNLYNKYLPKTVEDYYLHPEIQEFLKNLDKKNLPNLIISISFFYCLQAKTSHSPAGQGL